MSGSGFNSLESSSENFVGFTGQFLDGRLTKLTLIEYHYFQECNYDSYLRRKEAREERYAEEAAH